MRDDAQAELAALLHDQSLSMRGSSKRFDDQVDRRMVAQHDAGHIVRAEVDETSSTPLPGASASSTSANEPGAGVSSFMRASNSSSVALGR